MENIGGVIGGLGMILLVAVFVLAIKGAVDRSKAQKVARKEYKEQQEQAIREWTENMEKAKVYAYTWEQKRCLGLLEELNGTYEVVKEDTDEFGITRRRVVTQSKSSLMDEFPEDFLYCLGYDIAVFEEGVIPSRRLKETYGMMPMSHEEFSKKYPVVKIMGKRVYTKEIAPSITTVPGGKPSVVGGAVAGAAVAGGVGAVVGAMAAANSQPKPDRFVVKEGRTAFRTEEYCVVGLKLMKMNPETNKPEEDFLPITFAKIHSGHLARLMGKNASVVEKAWNTLVTVPNMSAKMTFRGDDRQMKVFSFTRKYEDVSNEGQQGQAPQMGFRNMAWGESLLNLLKALQNSTQGLPPYRDKSSIRYGNKTGTMEVRFKMEEADIDFYEKKELGRHVKGSNKKVVISGPHLTFCWDGGNKALKEYEVRNLMKEGHMEVLEY